MADIYKNHVDGKWLQSKSGKTFENRNPADRDDLIGLFPASGPDDVEEAVQAARRALAKWRLVPAPKRGELLLRVGGILSRRKDASCDHADCQCVWCRCGVEPGT